MESGKCFGAFREGHKVGVIETVYPNLLEQFPGIRWNLGPVDDIRKGLLLMKELQCLKLSMDIAPDAEGSVLMHMEGRLWSILKKQYPPWLMQDPDHLWWPLFQSTVSWSMADVAYHIREILKAHPDCIYVTVSGNFAPLPYQKPWKPGISIGPDKTIHDFGDGYSAIPMTLLPDDEVIVTLQWDDPWGYAVHDYDLFLTDPNRGEVVATSMNIQDETGEPFEHLVFRNEMDESRRVSLSIVRNGENTPNILEMYIRNIDNTPG